MENNKNFISLAISIGVIVLIILIVAVSLISKKLPSPGKTVKTSPQSSIVSPSPIPIFNSIKNVLSQPWNYKNLIMEYRPDSKTIIISFSGSIESAKQNFQQFVDQAKISDLSSVQVKYFSLNPITPHIQR